MTSATGKCQEWMRVRRDLKSCASEWMQAEQGFRLCQNLRIAIRDAENLTIHLGGRISGKDRNVLLEHVRLILPDEAQLRGYIPQSFATFAFRAGKLQLGSQEARNSWADPEQVRNALKHERETLLRREVELLDMV